MPSFGEDNREAPAQAELRPTCAGPACAGPGTKGKAILQTIRCHRKLEGDLIGSFKRQDLTCVGWRCDLQS